MRPGLSQVLAARRQGFQNRGVFSARSRLSALISPVIPMVGAVSSPEFVGNPQSLTP